MWFGFGRVAWLVGYVFASLVASNVLVTILESAASPFLKLPGPWKRP